MALWSKGTEVKPRLLALNCVSNPNLMSLSLLGFHLLIARDDVIA